MFLFKCWDWCCATTTSKCIFNVRTCLAFSLACRIGSEGTFTQGHLDSKDNFAYQIIGQKQWTVYPPTDFDNLYFVPNKGVLEWSQALKSETLPDTKQFPLYAKTHPLSFILNEGEVLYLPRGWIHTVKNLTPSLMINVWRRGPAAITAPWIEENAREIERLCSAWVLPHSKFMYPHMAVTYCILWVSIITKLVLILCTQK